MRESPLPPQWACLQGRVHYVQQHSPTEWSATCPECGGDVHPSGEWPDNCRLFTGEHPFLWCSYCGLLAYPDQYGDSAYTRPSTQELQKFRQKQIDREEAALRSADQAIAFLRGMAK